MEKDDDENLGFGVLDHLGSLRLDVGVQETARSGYDEEAEEAPTKPDVPRAKIGVRNTICAHGLRLEDCEECRLRSAHAGRYELVNPEDIREEK